MIAERRDQREKDQAPGTVTSFDAARYTRCTAAEWCVNRLKQWQCVAVRHEKQAANYRAMVALAVLMTWLAA